MDDLAISARQRLDVLLDLRHDAHLETSAPEPFPGKGSPEWAVGFQDASVGVHLTVWFVRDPTERDQAARQLAPDGHVGMNGPLLFFGRGDLDSDEAVDRLDELGTRFAGKEKG